MLLSTGLELVVHEKPKYLGAVLGTAVSLFLVLLLSGFYFGFRRDITIVQDSFDADLWVTSREISGFDFPGTFDDLVLTKVVSHPAVQAASRVVVDFSKWRIPDTGAMENIQVVGFDPDSGIQTDWGIRHPNLPALLRADGQLLAVQLGVVFVAAAVVAGVVLLGALAAFARTPISVVLPGWVAALDVGMMALASALACGPSLWKVAWAEPAEAFRM